MKIIVKLFLLAILLSGLNACTKDTVSEHYTFYRPQYKTRDEVKAGIKSSPTISISNAGKIFVKGQYVFLNDIDKGVHIIDYSNPVLPRNIAFIHIPGCRDISVKDNYLYADCYTDLVTVDISNPLNAKMKSFINGVFPQRSYMQGTDPNMIVVNWIKVDTVIHRNAGDNEWIGSPGIFSTNGLASSQANAGVAGSMSAFALMGDRMYTVDRSNLKVFNTSQAENPQYIKNVTLNSWVIETIFPFENKLLIGSQNGMLIYNVADPDNPVSLGSFSHARACDPVIADGNRAYVTLKSGGACAGNSNQLDVLDISNVLNPQLIKSYQLANPAGLAKDGNKLMICDGDAGFKLFDAETASGIVQKAQLSIDDPYDVIAINGLAIVTAKKGLYFIDYSNGWQLSVKSQVNIPHE
jgi:hypothetical protein